MKNFPKDAVALFETIGLDGTPWPLPPRTPRSTSLVENRRAAGSEDKSPMEAGRRFETSAEFAAYLLDHSTGVTAASHAAFLAEVLDQSPAAAGSMTSEQFAAYLLAPDHLPGESRRPTVKPVRLR